MDTEKDRNYMKIALEEARKAYAINEVPIGAVIVYKDQIIGRGYNRRNTDKSTLAHAEILAMEEAMAFIGDWRLEETTMYITLEPCPMCAGAIVQARIPRVVLGAMNPKAGSAGSVVNLLNEPKFNHQVQVEYDVCHDACKAILQDFFKELREQKKGLR
jgi:tRNA(adenine34) deaminase